MFLKELFSSYVGRNERMKSFGGGIKVSCNILNHFIDSVHLATELKETEHNNVEGGSNKVLAIESWTKSLQMWN